ncbi:S-adenosyl-L-methionine-dependent methyltransferase [Ascodesmis nigricans]|uniref:S-adenosyl-L-methionine-dependent methyltransferase n=1 Tax=Ascodesmis nigricans TaxID=341454 RepID=A0A4S2N413_9PEZI|nr:S-adenosyl-L-methionine-dependent methyltransferase [Ascodesmis nigricans]
MPPKRKRTPKVKAKASPSPPPPPRPSAARSASSRPARAPLTTDTDRSKRQLRALAYIIIAAITSHTSVLSLSPVYGGTPSSLYHVQILSVLFVLAWFTQTLVLKSWKPPSYLLPIMAIYTPAVLRYSAQWSSKLGAVYGPIVTEAITLYPLFTLTILSAASVALENSTNVFLDSILGIAPLGFFFHHLQAVLPGYIGPLIGSTWFLTRCGLWHAIGALFTLANLLSPSRLPSRHLTSILISFLVPGLLYNSNQNTMCTLTPAINATLADYNHTLIARKESLTGYISVLDNTDINYRVLRCDHSLLGGEWQQPPKGYSWPADKDFREPVYAVFVIMEAVRLIDPPPKGDDNHNHKALAIGLGIGTSVDALIRHGIETDIVELDPVVYEYAQDYFFLSKNHTAYLEDATEFVARETEKRVARYDYVLHDVFTGGAVPAGLFTREFLMGLERMMADDGVIAINWAGDLNALESQMVVRTMQSVFKGCRSFREYAEKAEGQKEDEDFINMVTFCTTPRNPSTRLTFRAPRQEDLLNSLTRKQMLMPKHEVDLDTIFAKSTNQGEVTLLTKANTGLLKKWQRNGAVGHWGLIRTVVPGRVWEEY